MQSESHEKVFRMKSACRDGTLKNQPNKMGKTPQHIHTIPTSCAILPTMFCVFSCVYRMVVEGSGEGIAVCVVHVDVHGVCCVVGGCNVVATEHGRYSLSFCSQKL